MDEKDRHINIVNERMEFIRKYRKDKGWEDTPITMEQVMEILEHPDWDKINK